MYIAVAIALAISVSGWYYLANSQQTDHTGLLMVPKATSFKLLPSGHMAFGPANLSGNQWWTVTGAFTAYVVPTGAGSVTYCLITSAQLEQWQTAGFPSAGCNSGDFVGGPYAISDTFFGGSLYYAVWVNLYLTTSATITITTSVVATPGL